MGKNRFRCAT